MIRKTGDLSVRRQCELIGVTRSKVYYAPKTPDEDAAERKERIMARIDYWHTESPAWGTRKIRTLLRNDGYLVTRKNVQKYMDGKSRWADNIMIERWFRSLKTEKIYIEEYTTERELRDCIAEFVDQYNNVRPHEALDYVTPSSVYAASFAVCA